ncbi:hypothetical protein J1N35_013524 [Gossypium stocksii]|uniref:Endonuclease/exonuclease/phosphatase domain-containing protein n=1 Tax=Gossypium stocksii TaxID=47602 RepID=A0A9D4A6S8_9ROSI|nr:hypothetical protein J1N35_013524 [Gossypium stocksii]
MLKIYHPHIIFFMETKLSMTRMEKVRRRCGFFNGIDIPSEGFHGGLSLGWNGGSLVSLQSFSHNHIDVEIQEADNAPWWRFTSFYGAPEVRNKQETWDLLRRLGRNNSLPWLVGGDFNDILFANEKQERLPREEARMEVFRRTLDDCHLENIGFSERSEEILGKITEVKLHLNMEIDKEERYWEQRARANWLKMEDKNTTFFHKYASQRNRVNRIRGLQHSDGPLATNSKEMESIVKKYFSDLFTSNVFGNLDHILSGVQPCISETMNYSLMDTYTEGEIIEALKGIGPTKASGADGFPALFYQQYWHIIGKDTCAFCLEVLNKGSSLEEINVTHLVLIPKTANPTNLKNFYPISFCTVIYMIIAKTVANRLQKF